MNLRLCLLLALSPALLAVGADRARYDLDGDDMLGALEYARYVLDLHSPPLSQFDENLDGEISGAEQQAVARALRTLEGQVSPCVEDFLVDFPDGQPMADFINQGPTCQLRDERFFEGDFPQRLMVRSSPEDLVLFRPRSGDSRRGAMFSFARDLNRSANIASIKGSIIRPINLADKHEGEQVRYLLPSVTMNLMSDETGRNKNVDTLTFRLAYETGFSPDWLNWARIGASPILTTDKDFDLDIRGAEFQFEPTVLGSGMNASRQVGPLRLRWRGFTQMEYGRVFAGDDRLRLGKGDEAIRLGGKLALRLWPERLLPEAIGKRLVLDTEYLYLWEVAGDLGDRDYFEVGLGFLLDRAGHFRLQTKYIRGDATQALEAEESWTIGLGVLY